MSTAECLTFGEGCSGGAFVGSVDRDCRRSGFGEEARDRGADAACAAGDETCLTAEIDGYHGFQFTRQNSVFFAFRTEPFRAVSRLILDNAESRFVVGGVHYGQNQSQVSGLREGCW